MISLVGLRRKSDYKNACILMKIGKGKNYIGKKSRLSFSFASPLKETNLEEGFGQQMRKVLLTVLQYPSAGKVGINC